MRAIVKRSFRDKTNGGKAREVSEVFELTRKRFEAIEKKLPGYIAAVEEDPEPESDPEEENELEPEGATEPEPEAESEADAEPGPAEEKAKAPANKSLKAASK